MSEVIQVSQGVMIDPSDEELFREYWNYKTEDVEAIRQRFMAVREQANKRVHVAIRVLEARSRDNHEKPLTQFIRPAPLVVSMKIDPKG